jgi:nitrate/nitrite transporter NarK
MAGMVGGGWITDRLTRAIGVRWGRGLPMALTRFMAMSAYIACFFLDSPWAFTVAFCFVAVSTDLGTASVWAFKQDIGGRHVGSVLGWGNMWGNFGAALLPIALPAIPADHGWAYRFAACALAFLVAGIAALGVDATKPIMPGEKDKSADGPLPPEDPSTGIEGHFRQK